MADYIKREAAIRVICDCCAVCADIECCDYAKGSYGGCKEIEGLRAIPAADVVEVVRCKDCIYSRFDLDMSEKAAPWLLCKKLRDAMFPLMVAKTDYCCWAERKEG